MSYRCLVLDYPGARGVEELMFGFQSASFEVSRVWIEDLFTNRLEQDQLFLRYKVLVLPGLVAERSRWLSLQMSNNLKWNLKRFAERGGLVLAVGTATDALIHLGIFGEQLSVLRKSDPLFEEKWVRVSPVGQRCEWLKGVGTLDLPIDSDTPFLMATPSGQVEVLGRLERLGMNCLRAENGQTMGMCDVTGRIFALFPEPQFAILANANRLPTLNGPAKALFENASKVANA